MLFLAILGFVGVGLALGLLGGGGSILAVPVLVNLLGVSAAVAVPMSLPVVGLAALFGAVTRWRKGQLDVPTVAWFAACAMPMSYAAAKLGRHLDDRPRLILFAVTLCAAAWAMWRRAAKPVRPAAEPDAPRHKGRIVPAALAVGALTGLVGVGGGFLIVPALTGVLGLPMAEATATSLAVIALNSAAAAAGYVGTVALDPSLMAVVVGAALVGMLVGTRLAPRVSPKTLARAFAILLVAVACSMIARAALA